MRKLATCVLAAVASSGGVSAEPDRTESTQHVDYNEHHHARPAPARSEDGWLEIASPTPATNGREFIPLDEGSGKIASLRIAASSGRLYVDTVRVEYADGTHRLFAIERVLDASKRAPALVDLRGPHDVRQIVVTTDASTKGSYVVHAR
jgi:hypothetical protein